jgi:hypothetical protein
MKTHVACSALGTTARAQTADRPKALLSQLLTNGAELIR